MKSGHAHAQIMHDAVSCSCINIVYAGLLCISAQNSVAQCNCCADLKACLAPDSKAGYSRVTAASACAQVIVYRLPSLPGNAPGESKGYAVSGQPLTAPANSTVHTPAFGSAGIAATEGAEFVYVGSPAAPQSNPQFTFLFGVPTVYVFQVCLLPTMSSAVQGVKLIIRDALACRGEPPTGWLAELSALQ